GNPVVYGGAAVSEVKATLRKTGPGEQAGAGTDGAGGQKPLQSGCRAGDEFAKENCGDCDRHGVNEAEERIVPLDESYRGAFDCGFKFVEGNRMVREQIAEQKQAVQSK